MAFNVRRQNIMSSRSVRAMRTLQLGFDATLLTNVSTQRFLVVVYFPALGALKYAHVGRV